MSKLGKWILENCFENNGRLYINVFGLDNHRKRDIHVLSIHMGIGTMDGPVPIFRASDN